MAHVATQTVEPTNAHAQAVDGSIAHLLTRIRAEYLEVPGLNLTKQQAQRFWGVDQVMCQALLDALVDARFLRLTHTGRYARADIWLR